MAATHLCFVSGEKRLDLRNVCIFNSQRGLLLFVGQVAVGVVLLANSLRRRQAAGAHVHCRLVDRLGLMKHRGVVVGLEDEEVWRGGVLSLYRGQVAHALAFVGLHGVRGRHWRRVVSPLTPAREAAGPHLLTHSLSHRDKRTRPAAAAAATRASPSTVAVT